MSSVPITIVGTIKDNDSDEEKQVTITGLAHITGLSVGGGPIIPSNPPGIWGPNDPRPQPPIPIYPGGTPNPPGIWGPPGPWPSPPISGIPGLPGYEPPKPGEGHEPKFEAKVGWTPETGWIVVFVPAEGTLVPTPSQ